METRTDPKLVPAVTLLNELDNLLAQIRSMELDLKRAQAETDAKITALLSQIAQLESARAANEEEIASLWHRAEVQERALIERREAVTAVELALHGKIQSLQQDLARSRRDSEEYLAVIAETRTPANRRELDEQEKKMKIDDVNQSPAENATEHEEGPASPFEQSLRAEIDRLTREAHERNEILLNRNDELVRIKSELDRLMERDRAIESASSRAESTYGNEAERMRNEFQAQLALLQAELSQKEWALEERQAEARGREQNLRQEIDSLRRQLAERENQNEHHAHDFVFGEAQSNLAEEPQFELTGKETTGNGENVFAGQRRWISGFGSKRRWRT